MNKKTHKKYVALLTMLAIICTMFCTSTAKANTELPWDESDVAETYTCTINSVDRTLTLLTSHIGYLNIGDSEPFIVGFNILEIGFDQNGTIWTLCSLDDAIRWWNYDLSPNDRSHRVIKKPTLEDPDAYVNDVESLVFDENNQFVVGYKTFSGETYPILTLDEMKEEILKDSETTPTPSPSAVPTPTPATPTPTPITPTATPNVSTPAPIPTATPVVTTQPVVSPKISITKKAGFSCLSVGNKVTSKYKLQKSKLTWKGSSKSKTYSGVKSAGFIKKSNNLIFMTKKGQVYTLSPNGKKKTILKKGAKKLILKDKFVAKVQTGKKNINVVNM